VSDRTKTETPATEARRFVRFVGASGVSAIGNVLARLALSEYLDYRWAVALAYIVGMTIAFALNKMFVFERSGKSLHREVLGFCLVNCIGAIQVWSISVGLAEYFFPAIQFRWHPELVAHITGLSSLAATSYVGHKYLSFGRIRKHESQ